MCICLAPPGLTLLAIDLLIEFEKLTAHLVKGLEAGASNSEVSILFSCLLNLVQAVTLHEMRPVHLIRAQG